MELPQHILSEVRRRTGHPGWDGRAHVEWGYPDRTSILELGIGSAVDDLHDVIEWLREDRLFEQSDRLRTITGRLARLQSTPAVDGSSLIRDAARGWR